jgi:hypothetical protein
VGIDAVVAGSGKDFAQLLLQCSITAYKPIGHDNFYTSVVA